MTRRFSSIPAPFRSSEEIFDFSTTGSWIFPDISCGLLASSFYPSRLRRFWKRSRFCNNCCDARAMDVCIWVYGKQVVKTKVDETRMLRRRWSPGRIKRMFIDGSLARPAVAGKTIENTRLRRFWHACREKWRSGYEKTVETKLEETRSG